MTQTFDWHLIRLATADLVTVRGTVQYFTKVYVVAPAEPGRIVHTVHQMASLSM